MNGSGPPQQKIRVIILTEEHYSEECKMKNRRLLGEILQRQNVPRESILFVSEGNHVNPCYEGLGIPEGNHILESDNPAVSNMYQLQMLMFVSETYEKMLSFQEVDMEMFKYMVRGFMPLLKKLPEGAASFKKITSAILIKKGEMELQQKEEIYREHLLALYKLIHEHGFKDEPAELREFLQGIVQKIIKVNGKYSSLHPIFDEIFDRREKNVLEKVTSRIQADPTISTVVIIFGGYHHSRFEKLFASSPLFLVDDSLSNTTVSNKRKSKRRKQKRRRSTKALKSKY
jgi:hypothetical protein